MKCHSCFCFFFIFLLLSYGTCNAQFLDKRENLEIASTECTDGTQVFGVSGDISTKLYVIKNGKIVYYNDEYRDVRELWSVYCLKNAIVITGINNTNAAIAAITSFENTVQSEQVAGYIGKAKVLTENGTTVINIYEGWPENENVVSETATFSNNFEAALRIPEIRFDFKTNYSPVKKPGVIAQITAMSTCYNSLSDTHYTATSYVQNNKRTYVDVASSEKFQTDNQRAFNESMPIPFVAKNSMCIDNNTYIFGKVDDKLQAIKIFYDEIRKRFDFKTIPLADAPLHPFVK